MQYVSFSLALHLLAALANGEVLEAKALPYYQVRDLQLERHQEALREGHSIIEVELPVSSNGTTSTPPAQTTNSSVLLPWRFFEQPVDHFYNSLDWDEVSDLLFDNLTEAEKLEGSKSFEQLYAVDDQYWNPASPSNLAILYLPGEGALGPYPVEINRTQLAGGFDDTISQRYGALHFMAEHRYYGNGTSIPVTSSLGDPTSLRYLTSRQAMRDYVNFAKNIHTSPDLAYLNISSNLKWIVVGGSYAGAMTAWLLREFPDVFFAGHSSSGPVEATLDFWQYGDQVYKSFEMSGGDVGVKQGWINMVAAFDGRVKLNETQVKLDVGSYPEMHIGDIGGIFSFHSGIVQYGVPYSDGNVTFTGDGKIVIPGTHVSFMNVTNHYLPKLRDPKATEAELYQTALQVIAIYNSNTPGFTWASTDTRLQANLTKTGGAAANLWGWQYCTEFGYLQSASPYSSTRWFSLTDSVEYQEWCCEQYFGKRFSKANTLLTNFRNHGSFVAHETGRVVYVNGQSDPWHRLSVDVNESGEGVVQSSGSVIFVERATDPNSSFSHHCSDLTVPTTNDPIAAQQVYTQIINTWDKFLNFKDGKVHF